MANRGSLKYVLFFFLISLFIYGSLGGGSDKDGRYFFLKISACEEVARIQNSTHSLWKNASADEEKYHIQYIAYDKEEDDQDNPRPYLSASSSCRRARSPKFYLSHLPPPFHAYDASSSTRRHILFRNIRI